MLQRNYQGRWKKTPGRVLGVFLILIYQIGLSPFLGLQCRHSPTCSEYGYEAIVRHGLWAGGWLVFFRFMQCHPWGTRPHFDAVPETLPKYCYWFMPWRYLSVIRK